MGSSTGNMLVNKEEILSGIFEHAPIVVVTHCEDDPIIAANSDQMRKRYGEDIPLAMHPEIRLARLVWLHQLWPHPWQKIRCALVMYLLINGR